MKLDFEKQNGLIPAVVQDSNTNEVLMLGYMNQEAIDKTVESGLVTFYSRSKGRLWTKGESSGNHLKYINMTADCDSDTLLVIAAPSGPVCHTGARNCFNKNLTTGVVNRLSTKIESYKSNPKQDSYTSSLFEEGLDRISQKVGEEAVELVIASKNNNKSRIVSEASDLVYHLLVLLTEKGCSWSEIEQELEMRSKKG